MVRGSCLCGQVSFVIAGPIHELSNCHCSQCRKAYGTAFGTIAVCSFDTFEYLTGAELISSYVQSPNVTRHFCQNCGSSLPIKEEGDPLVGIPAGLLDDDPGIKPSEHIYVASKAPWWDITDNKQQHEQSSPGSLLKRAGAPAMGAPSG